MAFSRRGASSGRPIERMARGSSPPTRIPTTTRLRGFAGPTRRRLRRHFSKCCWRVRGEYGSSARYRSTVSIDGTNIDANASKIRLVRGACPRAGRRPDPWDRAQGSADPGLRRGRLWAATIPAMEHAIGLPHTVPADAGFASGGAVAKPGCHCQDPVPTQPHRPTTSARRPSQNPSAASGNPGAGR